MTSARLDGAFALVSNLTEQAVAARRSGRVLESVERVLQAHEVLHDIDDADLAPYRAALLPLRGEWALTFALADRTREALMAHQRVYADARVEGAGETAASAAGSIALIHAVGGDLRNAEEWSRASGDASSGAEADASSTLALALVAVSRVENDRARGLLDSLPSRETVTSWAVHSYVEGLLAVQRGESRAGMLRLRATLDAHFPRSWSEGINAWLVASTTAYLQLDAGSIGRAVSAVDRHANASEELGAETAAAALAWAHLRAREPHKAVAVTAPYIDGGRGRIRTCVDMMLVAAATNLALGQPDAARRHYRSAFAIAAGERLWSPFLKLTVEERRQLADDATLLPEAVREARETTRALPARVRLSERERVILRHLVNDLALAEIAEIEHVSRNTVKTQTRSVFRKLGVENRAGVLEAVADDPELLS